MYLIVEVPRRTAVLRGSRLKNTLECTWRLSMNSLAGHLLIAPPQERDLDFVRTVILLIQHSEQQAFGVVLNRPTTTKVRSVWRGTKRCQCEDVVCSGGPVSGPLIALHTQQPLGEIEVLPGVCYSVQKKHLDELFHTPTHPLKVFDSHAGWGPGQLDEFVARGSWGTLSATPEHVFHAGPNLWGKVSKVATS